MAWLPRKLVHISGAAFAFIALYSPMLSLFLAFAGILVFFSLEVLKRYVELPFMPMLYRDSERKNIASEPLLYLLCIATLLAVSMVAMPSVCYAAIVVLTLGDGAAGIIGRAMGTHRLPNSKKTWEGSLAGLIAASAIGFIFAGPLAIAGAAVGMAAEAYTHRFENLAVAAAAFVAMALLSLFI